MAAFPNRADQPDAPPFDHTEGTSQAVNKALPMPRKGGGGLEHIPPEWPIQPTLPQPRPARSGASARLGRTLTR